MSRLRVMASSDETGHGRQIMRTESRRPTSLLRAALLAAACIAFLAMTSGLLLAIHTGLAGHSADHDSHACPICQHLLLAKEAGLTVGNDTVQDAPAICVKAPEYAEHIATHLLPAAQPRGPPCS